MSLELEEKKAQLDLLNALKENNTNPNIELTTGSNTSCSSPEGAYKIVHQYVPTLETSLDKQRKLQVVTQTLHIPPSGDVQGPSGPSGPSGGSEQTSQNAGSGAELEKLRKEVKKLREYARLSVQDRKVLIHKIGTLKDKVHETSVRKSASPLRSINTAEVGVQCTM